MTRTSLSRGRSLPGLAGVRSSGRAAEEKAMALPSGAHSGAAAPRGISVRAQASPPAIDSRWICGGCTRPSRSTARTNARRLPSGDHRGAVSRMPLVSGRAGALPSMRASQIVVS